VEFDETGDYLATGDKGGRVVLFERGDGVRESLLLLSLPFLYHLISTFSFFLFCLFNDIYFYSLSRH